LPVRELVAQVAVNANTVARAYRDLQAEGILTLIRGTGLAVTAEAPDLQGGLPADGPRPVAARRRKRSAAGR
jgi:GntR family transcriptional regulator